jgi:triosephosphate isomerase
LPAVRRPVRGQAPREGTNIKLGAQNIHWAQKGAFTGEISADMLKSLGVSYAIIGHSERRQYFGETDETVNMRAKAAIAAGVTPIICVGESLDSVKPVKRTRGYRPDDSGAYGYTGGGRCETRHRL